MKRLTVNLKKIKKMTGCLVVSKRDSYTFQLRIGDVKINHVQKFNYLDRLVTEGGMYDKEGRRMENPKHFNAEN